jgi:hypothetical protein
MALQKGEKTGLVALADLAQHPADGLPDQVVLVAQQDADQAERLAVVARTHEGERADNRNPSLPD